MESNCAAGDTARCDNFRVAELNVATGEYVELGPDWYLGDIVPRVGSDKWQINASPV